MNIWNYNSQIDKCSSATLRVNELLPVRVQRGGGRGSEKGEEREGERRRKRGRGVGRRMVGKGRGRREG